MAHTKVLKKEDSVTLSCNGSPLTESDSFKYVGVVIDKHLSFNMLSK